jgi:molybdenum cofactor biosynthesis enzyme MoaA
MTPEGSEADPEIFAERLELAARIAERNGVDTALITGKGEPTLLPISVLARYTKILSNRIPLVELQTNGLFKHPEILLPELIRAGMTTLSVSSVHPWSTQLSLKYLGGIQDLEKLAKYCQDSKKLLFRVTIPMIKECFPSTKEVWDVISWALDLKIPQITFRQISFPPDLEEGHPIRTWIEANAADAKSFKKIIHFEETPRESSPWGEYFDVQHRLSVGWVDCCDFNRKPTTEAHRSLVLHSGGEITNGWESLAGRLA